MESHSTPNRRPTPLGRATKKNSNSTPRGRKLPSPATKELKQEERNGKDQIYDHNSEGICNINIR